MYNVDLMLFDLDGTLIDSRTDLARSVNLMLIDLGYPQLSEEMIASFVGDGVPTLTRRSLTAAHPEHSRQPMRFTNWQSKLCWLIMKNRC